MKTSLFKFSALALFAVGAFGLSACSTQEKHVVTVGSVTIHDPYEDANRAVFS